MYSTRRSTAALMVLAGLASIGVAAPAATAQTGEATTAAASPFPQRDTAIRLMRPVTVSFEETRLEDVVNFIRDLTGAQIDARWADGSADGLDREQQISLDVQGVTALTLIEKVLEQAESEFATGGNAWQFSPTGALVIGPKERLNRTRRVEIYNIADLLIEIPDYTNAPEFDLSQVLQQSGGGGGGGGGQSPFQTNQQDDLNRPTMEERAREIQDILLELVEPEQWVDNGGDAATIRYWQGNFIVNAPDYIHREINGYPWWPARATRVTMRGGRRYVSLNMDVNFAEIEGFANQPVSAVVGGRIITSDPGDGG